MSVSSAYIYPYKSTFVLARQLPPAPTIRPCTHLLPHSSISPASLYSLFSSLLSNPSERPLPFVKIIGTHQEITETPDSNNFTEVITETILDFSVSLSLDTLLSGSAKLQLASQATQGCRGSRKPSSGREVKGRKRASPSSPEEDGSAKAIKDGDGGEAIDGEYDPRVMALFREFAESKSPFKVFFVEHELAGAIDYKWLESHLRYITRPHMGSATSIEIEFPILQWRHELLLDNWARNLVFPGEVERKWLWKKWDVLRVTWEVEKGAVEKWVERTGEVEKAVKMGELGWVVMRGERLQGEQSGDRAGAKWWADILEVGKEIMDCKYVKPRWEGDVEKRADLKRLLNRVYDIV